MALDKSDKWLVGLVLIVFLMGLIAVLPGYYTEYMLYFVLIIFFAVLGLLKAS